MVVAAVDAHVGARRHMTGGAGGRRAHGLVTVVRDRRVLVGRMTLQANAVTGRAQLRAVRLVAIAAGDAGRKHPALLERAVIVDFVEHLPVGVIAPAGERRDPVRVGKPPAWNPVLGESGAARVAEAAGLDLLAQQRRREVARGIARARTDRPGDVAPLAEPNEQPLVRVFALAGRPPALLRSCPVDVSRTLSMTRLAAHADFRKARGKAIVGRIVVLAHAGRMTLRAHEVPVLIELGPVQDVVVLDLLVRIEMEPALTALALGPAVPGDRQSLQPAIGECDEILLQRVDPERVLDFEGGELSVWSVGLDKKLPVLAEETGMHAVIVETRVVEIAEHRLVGRVLHGEVVLRGAPQLRFGTVAAGAGLAADERGRAVAADAKERCLQSSARRLKSESAGHRQRRTHRCRDEDRPLGQRPFSLAASSCGIRWRRRALLQFTFFPRALFGTCHRRHRSRARPVIAERTFAWPRQALLCSRLDCRGHRAAWRAPRLPRTMFPPAPRPA